MHRTTQPDGESEQVVRMLLQNSPSTLINTVDRRGRTPLHFAASKGNCELVGELLEKSPGLAYMVSEAGETALHCAARGGHDEVVAQLLAADPALIHAGVLEYMNHGRTALHFAAEGGHDQIVARLLAAHPPLIDVVSSDGTTALHCAASYQIAARLLAASPPLLRKVDRPGHTALHRAASKGLCQVVAQLLAEDPSLIDRVTCEGKTALHCAVEEGRKDVVAQLLRLIPDSIDAVDDRGRSVLHMAVSRRYEAIAILLLAAKPGLISMTDQAGQTPLHTAGQFQCRNEFVVALWRLHPCALRTANIYGDTPFDLVILVKRPAGIKEALLWGLSLDEIDNAVQKHKHGISAIFRRPTDLDLGPVWTMIKQQVQEVLNSDVSRVVCGYLAMPF